ncbi:MAG TPA: DUF1802 family protein [Tepidisphaeraceae bacterium]|jgi:hypothetical protein|nr:DUF1802 family protein [Tepidisphaeraceae bacterium]
MAWPVSLSVGLKEWATVCAALENGRQMLLLRKGGIYEAAGEFELEHRQFLLFPTYLHQNLKMLKPEFHAGFEARTAEPQQVRLTGAGVVTDIIRLSSRAQMDALEAEHVWTPPLIDMRFSYKPENPLYLLLVRAYQLHEPVMIENTPAYAGCKSWVPLDKPIGTGDAAPVLDDARYEMKRKGILEKMK